MVTFADLKMDREFVGNSALKFVLRLAIPVPSLSIFLDFSYEVYKRNS